MHGHRSEQHPFLDREESASLRHTKKSNETGVVCSCVVVLQEGGPATRTRQLGKWRGRPLSAPPQSLQAQLHDGATGYVALQAGGPLPKRRSSSRSGQGQPLAGEVELHYSSGQRLGESQPLEASDRRGRTPEEEVRCTAGRRARRAFLLVH